MRPSHKPDPYKDFKDDDQRRRALNWKSTCDTIKAIGVALAVAVITMVLRGDIRPLLKMLL